MPRKKETRGRKKTMTDRQVKKNAAAAQLAWKKEHIKHLNIALNTETDADIIAYLETKKMKMAYIRDLIREDMKKNGQ